MVCSMLYALYSMLYALCSMLSALCSMHTVYFVDFNLSTIQRTTKNKPLAVSNDNDLPGKIHRWSRVTASHIALQFGQPGPLAK